MPTSPRPVTLAQAVRRAVEVCDAGAPSARLYDFQLRFEDADEPISAVADIQARVQEVRLELDPLGDDPALAMAAAVVIYLAFRRDEIGEEPLELLRLAARSEFGGKPAVTVERWLIDAGVAL